MKKAYPAIGLGRLCWLLGLSRQSFYQHFWQSSDKSIEQLLLLKQISNIRAQHPVLGTRKLLLLLQPFLLEHSIKIGRDALFELLSEHKLLVKKRKHSVKTTQSHHWLKKYSNLIKDWQPSAPMQLWVADITYVPICKGRFLYLSLITDAYSRKIVGYQLADTLEGVHTLCALRMALVAEKVKRGLIHHSDRGIQYCSLEYTKLLTKSGVLISMTQSGDPLENPLAERINGIIKNEYLHHYNLQNSTQATKLLEQIIECYNKERPHQSIGMQTPQWVHAKQVKTREKSKNNRTCKPISGLSKNL